MNKGNELVLLGTLKITMSNFLANFIYSDAISSFNASFFNGSHSRTFLVASRSSLSQDDPLCLPADAQVIIVIIFFICLISHFVLLGLFRL